MSKKKPSHDRRVKRAINLIQAHPDWTRARVQSKLRQELGAGIRYKVYGRINAWAESGFIYREIKDFLTAKNWLQLPNTAPAAKARSERTRWIADLKRRGWTNQQIVREINAYYDRDLTRSPFDFLRKYKPKTKKASRDYSKAHRERSEKLKAQTKNLYGSRQRWIEKDRAKQFQHIRQTRAGG